MVGAGRLFDGECDERGCVYGSGSAPGPGPAVAREWCGGESEWIQLFSRLMMVRGGGHSNMRVERSVIRVVGIRK
jgi:hypothetical protein